MYIQVYDVLIVYIYIYNRFCPHGIKTAEGARQRMLKGTSYLLLHIVQLVSLFCWL